MCAVDAVAGDVVVGADRRWGIHIRIRKQLVVVVGMHVCQRLVVVVYVRVIAVGAFAFVGGWWSLWACTFVGGWWSLCTFVFVGG